MREMRRHDLTIKKTMTKIMTMTKTMTKTFRECIQRALQERSQILVTFVKMSTFLTIENINALQSY